MKKVMLIRLSSLGDVIFNIPLANVLKDNGYEVTWLVSEKGIDVVKNNPAVDKAVLIPLKKWKQNGFCIRNVIEFFQILKKLRSEHFDVAIDTQMMFKSMLWMKFCGAKRRICYTYGREFSHLGGNERFVPAPIINFSLHAVKEHLQYAKYLQLNDYDKIKFTLPPSQTDTIQKVDNLLKNLDKSKPVVVICPATTWRLKHWNRDNWKQLIAAIKDKCSLIFSGTENDKELISYIGGDEHINIAGKTNVKDLIEVFSRAQIVISPDSGSAHLARATEIPAVISIFCCTPPTRYGPFGDDNKYFAISGNLNCQPCHTRVCPLKGEKAEQCVNYPAPEKIINIVNKLLQNCKHSV